jgi:hypothetical protein
MLYWLYKKSCRLFKAGNACIKMAGLNYFFETFTSILLFLARPISVLLLPTGNA